MPDKMTVALDYDGVMNMYNGWAGKDNHPAPRPGLREFLEELNKRYKVVIYTTRDSVGVVQWLFENGLQHLVDKVTSEKPMAIAYIDDRAICFKGDYNETLAEIKGFQVHWETKGGT